MTHDMHPDLRTIITRLERQLDAIHPPFHSPTHISSHAAELAYRHTLENIRVVRGESEHGFNPAISGQYATFIYFLAREIHKDGVYLETGTRLFLLNKTLNGIDLFYAVEMPPHFLIRHTVGAVFAKANYGDFCVFHQGCTVGRFENDRPTLGNGVVLYPGAAIIGRSRVGSNVVVSAGVQIINRDIPDNSIAFAGDGGRLVFKPLSSRFVDRYFNAP
jgi:serine O-acetyltransferase